MTTPVTTKGKKHGPHRRNFERRYQKDLDAPDKSQWIRPDRIPAPISTVPSVYIAISDADLDLDEKAAPTSQESAEDYIRAVWGWTIAQEQRDCDARRRSA